MKPISFEIEMTVPADAIDELNHVNNVTYLQWAQDVAEKHWVTLAPESVREKVLWVVLNHFIEYKNPAFEGDHLILKTWIEHYGGVKSERRTEIIRKKDGKIMVQAKTLWCLIDAESYRPIRITKEITVPFFK